MSSIFNTQQRAKVHAQTLAELEAANRKNFPVTPSELADVIGLLLVGLIALSGMGNAYGGIRYLVVGGLGLFIGLMVAWIFARIPLPLWAMSLVLLGVYVVIGPSLVTADAWVRFVAPSPSVVGDMLTGTYQGWANLLTTTTPVGGAQSLYVVPWVSGIVVGAASMSIARRGQRGYLAALIPPFVLFVASIVVGTPDPVWAAQATAFAIVALLWGSIRQRSARSAGLPGKRRNRPLEAAGLLVVACLVGFAVGHWSLVAGEQDRPVVRDKVDPPVDLQKVPSPLEGFRRYRADDRAEQVVFKVSGLKTGDLLRLATLDNYDGVVWHVQGGEQARTSSSLFRRVGEELPVDPALADQPRRTVTVEVGDYTGPWVPTPGAIAKVSFGGRATDLSRGFRYNTATNTAAEPGGLRKGDQVTMQVVMPPDTSDLVKGEPKALRVPKPYAIEMVRQQFARFVAGMKDTSTPLERVRSIERRLKGDGDWPANRRGYFSDGAGIPGQVESRPGHGAERMRKMLDPESGYIVGNEEQYASAMALLASEAGFPSRVVVGFKPKRVSAGGTTSVKAKEITAWAEIAVEGHGWVPLFATPTKTSVPDENPTVVPPPDRLIPPPPDDSPKLIQVRSGSAGGTKGCAPTCPTEGSGTPIPTAVIVAGAIVLPPVAIIGGITALMAFLKLRRRKKRRTGGTPSARVAAGWDDVCDLAVDLGDVVPPAATRREEAVILARPGVATLAQSADALVFGPGTITPDTADRYWNEVATTRAAILAPAGAFERWKALVNPTSLRKGSARRASGVKAHDASAKAAHRPGLSDRIDSIKQKVR